MENIIFVDFGKAHFYKNNAKLPILLQNFLDPAPYFRQTHSKIWGRIVQILFGIGGFASFL